MAKTKKPDTPPATASDPAPETPAGGTPPDARPEGGLGAATQEHAGAGETQANPDNVPTIVALLVTAQVEGFRRAGRAWSKTQTRVEAAELTDRQVEALLAEPMLDVVGVAG